MRVAEGVRAERTRETAALAFGLVLAACVVTIWGTPGDAYWIADCGNKALVSQRLVDTGFRDAGFDYPAGRFDIERRLFPIPVPFAFQRDGGFRSVFAPAYAALAAPALRWLGPRGLRLPAALAAALAAALFVLWAAPAVGRGRALAGSLVLALASPVFFYAVTVWEHTPCMALALAAWVLLSREALSRWAAAGALVGAGCWIREDMGLMAGGILAAAVLRRQPAGLWLAFAAGVALPVAPLLVFNQGFYGNALGGHFALQPGAVSVPAVLGGGASVGRLTPVAGLLGGFGATSAERWTFGGLGLGLPIAGWLGARIGALRPWLVIALGAAGLAAWGLAVARLVSTQMPLQALVLHNGLLLQWPMYALIGPGLYVAWREAAYTPLRTGLLAGVLFGALMLATGAAAPSKLGAHVGAGVHWGPRVLLPAVPALVLLVIAAVRVGDRARVRARATWALLVGAGVLSTALAIQLLAHQKLDGQRFTEQLRELEPRVLVTFHPYLAQHLAPLWYEKPALLVRDWADVAEVAGTLRRAGERRFLVVVPPRTRLPAFHGLVCRTEVTYRSPLRYFDLDVASCAASPR